MTLHTSHPTKPNAREHGFGLIEIVISMFLLALLAMAFLPVLVQGVKQSAANATLATATQLVQQSVESARSQTTCTGVTSTSNSVFDSRGVSLTINRVVGGTCPLLGYPRTVPVTVTVTRTATGAVVSSATTLIFVLVK